MPYKEPNPQEWMELIEEGLEYRRRFGVEDKWGTLEAIYYNVHGSMANDGPNILLSQGDAMLAQLINPSPRIQVSPRTPDSVEKAPLLESVDNTLIDVMSVSKEVDTATTHAYLFGKGILKMGYDSEWGFNPADDVFGDLRLGMTLTQLNNRGTRRIEYDGTIKPGMPWVRAVLPHDIVVPWGVMEIENTPWIAHRLVRHLDDLKADTKYKNTANLQPAMSMRDFVDSYRTTIKPLSRFGFSDPQWVEFYEIMDRRSGKVFAVVPGYDKFIRRETNALLINNQLPYAAISFTPRTRAFWTTPDAYYLLHVQIELSDTAVQRTKQRRLSIVKFLYDIGAISDKELAKVASPDVGAFVGIQGGRDIDKAIKLFQVQPNLLLAQEEELLRANAREQMGFSRNELGEFAGGRKTATEVSRVARASQLRMSRRGVSVRNLYLDVMKITNGIIFKHWNLPRYVELLGEEGARTWKQVRGKDLQGQFSYKVDLVDEEFERAQKFEAMQIYSMFSQDPSVDPNELRAYLTGNVNDPDFSRIFNADIRRQMPQVQQGGGGLPAQNGQRTSPQQLLQR